ncbi:transporter substrate-binding domain-containing protein [Paracoccus sp. S-4012]|uniref:transporter substrate-binding domain-containing protein n=1 Tax=Paracoccus sp. S-4012 TaxID=2665648 RepID=UPI0012B159B6|nr:transporter substrate-binding domain-containing protein [Paracoccus sp. S-4012]MRX48944.1 transporter substrate-binding domain-containing protein [Paracoccus sp. S-4012]
MPDPADLLAPAGPLRAAINLGNPILARLGADGAPEGVSVDLARAIAARLGREAVLLPVEAAPRSVAAVAGGRADIGFFAIDPERGREIAWTSPIVIIEGAYLVRAESPLRRIEDVDAPGVRIAAGRGSAYALHLARHLRQARLVEAPTSPEVVPQFLAQHLEAAAGIRQQMEADAARHPGLRVLPGAFMTIRQAVALARSRGEAAAGALTSLVAELVAGGAVADALTRHGIEGARAAGPGD